MIYLEIKLLITLCKSQKLYTEYFRNKCLEKKKKYICINIYIYIYTYIYPEIRQKIIDDLRLKEYQYDNNNNMI